MRQYLAFKGDCYYPNKGMGDFVGDFDNLADAITSMTTDKKTRGEWDDACEWAVVWDSDRRDDAWTDRMLPNNH